MVFLRMTKIHQLEIIKMIRKYQPEIVLCNAIDDRHIDHPKGSSLVSNACFLSGLIKIDTNVNRWGVTTRKVEAQNKYIIIYNGKI